MKIGMLWFDNDPNTELDAKIQKAAAYYAKKYGHAPTTCFVHPSMTNGAAKPGAIEIRTSNGILPNHFWLGRNDTQPAHETSTAA